MRSNPESEAKAGAAQSSRLEENLGNLELAPASHPDPVPSTAEPAPEPKTIHSTFYNLMQEIHDYLGHHPNIEPLIEEMLGFLESL